LDRKLVRASNEAVRELKENGGVSLRFSFLCWRATEFALTAFAFHQKIGFFRVLRRISGDDYHHGQNG
jgi:hypothetical protein